MLQCRALGLNNLAAAPGTLAGFLSMTVKSLDSEQAQARQLSPCAGRRSHFESPRFASPASKASSWTAKHGGGTQRADVRAVERIEASLPYIPSPSSYFVAAFISSANFILL